MLIETVATLRTVVGYLGEQDQFGWWQSTFFGPGSVNFLTPVFTRTHLLAQCTGAALAAARVHDERIGTGNVHHLFRLPEALEMGIRRTLLNEAIGKQLGYLIADRAAALHFLNTMAKGRQIAGIGPTHVAGSRDLRSPGQWTTVAGLYANAFQNASETFPYFADRS